MRKFVLREKCCHIGLIILWKAKYSTSIEKNGFILTILNLTVEYLNVSYDCSCGLDNDKHILYIDVYTGKCNNKDIDMSHRFNHFVIILLQIVWFRTLKLYILKSFLSDCGKMLTFNTLYVYFIRIQYGFCYKTKKT
jgi:hypothetical protein